MNGSKPGVTGYVYPWDVLGDPAAASWIKATGIDRVAMAAAYHSVRAATPRHPSRRIVDASSAALYVPLGSAWHGHALAPAGAAEWTGKDNSFHAAAAVLRSAGLPVDAWTVLTHSTAVGAQHMRMCVQNAFGEVYRYALCPSHPEVREYAATLVEQVLKYGRPEGLILEAAGPLGYGHQTQHDKTVAAEYSPWVQALLSLCFCHSCRAEYDSIGVSAETAQRRVREAILRQDEPGTTPETASDAQEFLPLLEARWAATAALLDACLAVIVASSTQPRLSVHTSPDPWSTGPFVPVEALLRSQLRNHMNDVTAVLPCWGGIEQGAATVSALQAAIPHARIGCYVLALPPKTADPEAMLEEWAGLAALGSTEIHLYHLGLASTNRLEAISGAVTGTHQGSGGSR